MTDEFKDEIRNRASFGDNSPQQTVSAGLFGIAEAELFESIVRDTFPRAVIGGVTNEQIEGAVLKVGTEQTRVFKQEIEAMLSDLGEDRVSQSAWNVEARRWEAGDDAPANVTGQQVTVRFSGVERVLRDLGERIVPEIVNEMADRGWPPGATNAAFDRGEIGDVTVNPIQAEVVYRLDKQSVDASKLRALEAYPRRTLQRVASVEDPLGLPTEKRIEIEKKLSSDYDIREVEVRILP